MPVSIRITNPIVTWVMTSWWWNNPIAMVTTQTRTSCATWTPFSWTPQTMTSQTCKTPCLPNLKQWLAGSRSQYPWSSNQFGSTLTMVMCSTPVPESFHVPVSFQGKRISLLLHAAFLTPRSGAAVRLPTSMNRVLPVLRTCLPETLHHITKRHLQMHNSTSSGPPCRISSTREWWGADWLTLADLFSPSMRRPAHCARRTARLVSSTPPMCWRTTAARSSVRFSASTCVRPVGPPVTTPTRFATAPWTRHRKPPSTATEWLDCDCEKQTACISVAVKVRWILCIFIIFIIVWCAPTERMNGTLPFMKKCDQENNSFIWSFVNMM